MREVRVCNIAPAAYLRDGGRLERGRSFGGEFL